MRRSFWLLGSCGLTCNARRLGDVDVTRQTHLATTVTATAARRQWPLPCCRNSPCPSLTAAAISWLTQTCVPLGPTPPEGARFTAGALAGTAKPASEKTELHSRGVFCLRTVALLLTFAAAYMYSTNAVRQALRSAFTQFRARTPQRTGNGEKGARARACNKGHKLASARYTCLHGCYTRV